LSISRNILLWASENKWMREHVPSWRFVKKAVKKFMPGETEAAALLEALKLSEKNLPSVFTKLGENINRIEDAEAVKNHYINLINKISASRINIEISLKLTQLGLDLSEEIAFKFCKEIADEVKAKLGNTLFLDMEGSSYTQQTVDFYTRLKSECDNVGLCLQAYLYRTKDDIEKLITVSPSIRLVKGAYKEATHIAMPIKKNVDENYLLLAKQLITASCKSGIRIIFATHDDILIEKIIQESKRLGLPKEKLEFQMLYGIKNNFLKNINERGYKGSVLLAYGESWYPWYMRRLAERPANVWFVIKNLFVN